MKKTNKKVIEVSKSLIMIVSSKEMKTIIKSLITLMDRHEDEFQSQKMVPSQALGIVLGLVNHAAISTIMRFYFDPTRIENIGDIICQIMREIEVNIDYKIPE